MRLSSLRYWMYISSLGTCLAFIGQDCVPNRAGVEAAIQTNIQNLYGSFIDIAFIVLSNRFINPLWWLSLY